MKKFAVVFPGQGSQSVGMFASFIEDPEVKRTYEEANDALSYDLKNYLPFFLLHPPTALSSGMSGIPFLRGGCLWVSPDFRVPSRYLAGTLVVS